MEKKYTSRRFVVSLLLAVLILCVGYPAVVQISDTDRENEEATTPQLRYGYAAPAVQAPGTEQISEFNTFIGHVPTGEAYNTTDATVTATVEIINHDGTHLSTEQHTLPPRGSKRFKLSVPDDTYGTVIIKGDGIVFRVYVQSAEEYVLPFMGK